MMEGLLYYTLFFNKKNSQIQIWKIIDIGWYI